jgi:hypothetical protein
LTDEIKKFLESKVKGVKKNVQKKKWWKRIWWIKKDGC